MPYKLEHADNGYYVVNSDTGKRHSSKPMSKNRAMAQMRALYAAMKTEGKEIDLTPLSNLANHIKAILKIQ